jgi:hypothetical protein
MVHSIARVPQLMVWGDHLNDPSDRFEWESEMQAARDRMTILLGAGASVEWIELPRLGIHGNSHLLMMDNNSADIARLIDRWIRRTVR